MSAPGLSDSERFPGERVILRRVVLGDCTPAYVGWLLDPEVNAYLETRWVTQSLETVRAFVEEVRRRDDTWLLAICHGRGAQHIGNIKIGPVDGHHRCGDVSYFIGERSLWGKGLATDAIRTAVGIAFERLGLHRVQAGVYAANVGSARALTRVGFRLEGQLRGRFRSGEAWDDHLIYGMLAGEWPSSR